jgi:hypothetical protein
VSHLVTESIWHFIGHLHLEELLSRTPVRYSGAGEHAPQSIDGSKIKPVREQADDLFPGGSNAPALKVDLPSGQPLIFVPQPAPHLLETEPASLPPTLQGAAPARLALPVPEVNPALDLTTVLPRLADTDAPGRVVARQVDNGGDGGHDAHEVVDVMATYTVGEDQLSDIHVIQANSLIDADVLRGDPAALIHAGLDPRLHGAGEASSALLELVQDAIEALPSSLAPPALADGIERAHVTLDGELKLETPAHSGVEAEAVEPGRYVNGERVGDSGTSADIIGGQIAKVDAAAETVTPVEHGAAEPQTSPDGPIHVLTGVTPTGGVAQEAVTGGNDVVNAAVLYDLADAQASMIVVGDVYVTNAIAQVNVLQDVDVIGHASRDLRETVVADNDVSNEATFVEETGPIFGNVMLGGVPGSLIWQVDYVRGNLYDVTTVEQYNVVLDADISEQTTTGSHFVATLGENGALNLAQLSELGTYDLIIVGGNLYEFNGIVQVNVLLDDDAVRQAIDGPPGDSDALPVDAAGNVLGNVAAIVRIGGDSYKPLAGDPAALADAVGDMQTEIDPTLATGLPGNGTDTLKVLYITGDYYNYNLLLQTNVLDDADQVQQTSTTDEKIAAHGEGGEDAGTVTQAAVTDGNALQNLALLVNVGSTSDYQFVGGQVYEDTLLVQANIVTDDGEAADADLHPDVVAAIAAMSGSTGDATTPNDTQQDHPDASAGVDVMGGILS